VTFALSVVLAAAAFPAGAASAHQQASRELTAANLASVLDPLMAEWIDKRKGPCAVIVVVTPDGLLFAKGYGFADVAARKPLLPQASCLRGCS